MLRWLSSACWIAAFSSASGISSGGLRRRAGGGHFVAEPLVERFFGLQGGAVEAVGAASVAQAHRLRHLGGFGFGEDVERGHAEGDDVGCLHHFRAGAGFVGGQGVDDFGPGFVDVRGGCGEVWQQESDDGFEIGA